MLAEEPEAGDECTAENHEDQLEPLIMAAVKFGHDNFTAGDVYKSTSRDAHENNINELVALRNLHANDDA